MSTNFKPQKNMIYAEDSVDNFREYLEHNTKLYKDKIAFSYKKDSSATEPEFINVTFEKHYEDVKNLSTKLLEMGLEEKNIGIISHNKYQWPVSYMAVTTGNMVAVPLDYLLPENELEQLLIRSKASAIVFDIKMIEKLKNIRTNNKTNLQYYICMDLEEDKDGFLSFAKLIEEGKKLREAGNTHYDEIKIDNNKMSIMLFTSGTTDISKAVMLSQKNICSNVSAMTTLIKYHEGDKVLSFLPMHHTFECTATYLFCSFIGFNICYCDGLKYIAKNMNEYKISGLVCVPAVLDVMYKQIQKKISSKGLTNKVNGLIKISNFLLSMHIDLRRVFFKSILDNLGGKIRTIIYGSASVDKAVVDFFNSIGIVMIQGYGLTETSPVIACENDKYQKAGSVGHVLYNEQVEIINKDENGIGEITVKGPNIMLGYYENEEKTKEVLVDGVFHTGDLGYIDDEGYLFITGRIKDMIVFKNGKKVFPQELEILLNNSDYILDSFVYLSTDEDEKLSCKLVYDPNSDNLKDKSEEEISQILRDEIKKVNTSVPNYKHIKGMILSTEPLIKTTTQKIKRHEELKLINAMKNN